MPRLTGPLLRAMEEALSHRLAGECDSGIPAEHYDRAWEWVFDQLAKRDARRR